MTLVVAKSRSSPFLDVWAERYPAVKTLWENAWSEFVPFLDYSIEIRRVIYSTNAIGACTPGCAGRPRREGTSPTSRPP